MKELDLSTEPIVTAKKYLEYKKSNGHFNEFIPPAIVLICYQESTLKYILNNNLSIKQSHSFSNLYLMPEGGIGILGGWGIGAPALSVKMEQLIALGVNKFIAIGIAGTLMNKHDIGEFIIASKALAEDGVAHLYLNGQNYVEADHNLSSKWNHFSVNQTLPSFHKAGTWSFSAIFRETPADIARVTKQGYDVVEMEAATLYAIGKEKGVQALSLFVISDTLSHDNWVPYLKEPKVINNLHKLSEWALDFCKTFRYKDERPESS